MSNEGKRYIVLLISRKLTKVKLYLLNRGNTQFELTFNNEVGNSEYPICAYILHLLT